MFYGSTYKQLTGRFLSQRGLFQQLAGLFWGILPIIIEALVVFSPLLQSKIKIRFFKFLLHFCGVNSRFGFPKYCSTFVALFWERNSVVLSLKVHRHENKSCSAFYGTNGTRYYIFICSKKSPSISSNILARRTIHGYT